MRTPYYPIGLAFSALILLSACEDDHQERASDPVLETASSLHYNAACQTDTLRFSASGVWTAVCDAPWVTMAQEQGKGNGTIALYIQQNDDEAARQGTLRIHTAGGDLNVPVSQEDNPNNGSPILNLARDYGLGWGYDCSVDYADIDGIRGQIFDAAALRRYYGDDMMMVDNATSTNMFFERAESSETLQQKIGGKVSGGLDLKVASAKVSVEFSQQITEQKDRLYVWCRDCRTVKQAYLSNSVDIYDADVLNNCATFSFWSSVMSDSPKEIVRKFGTHLVTNASLGGKLDYYFTVSQNVTTTVEKMVATINVKILFISASASIVDENTWTEIKKDFEGSFEISGGGDAGDRLNKEFEQHANKGEPLTDPTLFDQWYARFTSPKTAKDEDLVMVDFTVVPIWEIIYGLNPIKADAVEEYITHTYLK